VVSAGSGWSCTKGLEQTRYLSQGRSNPPITVELNGRRIFGKGSKLVNPEIFPEYSPVERYNGLLDFAVKCNFNLFRVWEVELSTRNHFNELCDEKGFWFGLNFRWRATITKEHHIIFPC